MSETGPLYLPATDPYERIAIAVREALPGDAGELLLARIVDELAAVDEPDAETIPAELHHELARQAATDPATGLPNRLSFLDNLTRAIAAAARYDEPLTLLVIDLEKPDADERSAGEALLRLVRVTDIVSRVAPGRFAIILPRTATAGGALVATRVTALEEHPSTIGSVTFAGEITDATALLSRAEDALDDRPTRS